MVKIDQLVNLIYHPGRQLSRDTGRKSKACRKASPRLSILIRIPAGHQKSQTFWPGFFGAPAGIRTPDTLLKRQVLCLLSYWGGYIGFSGGCHTKHQAQAQRSGLRLKRRLASEGKTFRSRGKRNRKKEINVAGMAGLEPTISESKSGVLPLHYIPVL